MPEVPLDWIILLMLFLISVGLVYFMLMRRLRVRSARRLERESREKFSLLFKRRAQPAPVPKEMKEALRRTVEAIEGAATAKRAEVKIRLGSSVELRAEAPDIISLRMPVGEGGQAVLHKSLERARIKNVKKVARGYEVRLVMHGG